MKSFNKISKWLAISCMYLWIAVQVGACFSERCFRIVDDVDKMAITALVLLALTKGDINNEKRNEK